MASAQAQGPEQGVVGAVQRLASGMELSVGPARLRVVALSPHVVRLRYAAQGAEQITLPDDVRRACIRATEVLGLRFTGMDLKADVHGTIKILELNPSPMFLGFDQRSGSDVLGALAAALAARAASVR